MVAGRSCVRVVVLALLLALGLLLPTASNVVLRDAPRPRPAGREALAFASAAAAAAGGGTRWPQGRRSSACLADGSARVLAGVPLTRLPTLRTAAHGRDAAFAAPSGFVPPLVGAGRRSPLAVRHTRDGIFSARAQVVDSDASQTGLRSGVGPICGGWGESVRLEEEALLPEDPDLVRGSLGNGLRYSILKNKVPPKRFYVNLEVHVGSIDETDDQQGLAHFLEHMLFLGSEAYPHPEDIRKVLTKLGMSQLADANAYTDFRSTVYTLSAPTYGSSERVASDNAMAARKDTLFRTGLVDAPTTIMTPYAPYDSEEEEEEFEDDEEFDEEELFDETAAGATAPQEGKAGDDGSESEGNLGLVLGLLHQMTFKALIREEDVNSERNAVLNEMRDTSNIDDRVASKYYQHLFNETLLPRRFPIGKEKIVREATAADLRRFYDAHYHPSNMHIFVVGDIEPAEIRKLIESVYGGEPQEPRGNAGGYGEGAGLLRTPAHSTPDDVMHRWPARGQEIKHRFYEKPHAAYEEVRHSQLTSFFLSMTIKEELESNAKYRHMYEEFVDSLVGMALDSRAQELRSQSADPPLQGLDWSYLNSPREGCVMDSLTVHGEARNWRVAVESAAGIIGSIVKYGLVQSELDRLVMTLMKQFELDAEQEDTQESASLIGRLQECAEAGDAFMTASQRLVIFRQLLPVISLDAVNARARQLYGFAVDGGQGSELRHLFVCGPTQSTEGDNFDSLGEENLQRILRESAAAAVAYQDTVQVPEFLCADEEMARLEQQVQPSWAPLSADITCQPGMVLTEGGARGESTALNITMRRLANGVRVVYKRTPFEKKQLAVEMHLLGGRACEGHVEGLKTGALSLALQTAMESGLGDHSFDSVVRYCQLHDLDYDMRGNFEGSAMEISASTSQHDGVRRAFELAHLIMANLRLEQVALERLQRAIKLNWEAESKNLESRTSRAMLDLLVQPSTKALPDPRFASVTPEDAGRLGLADLRRALDVELTPDNLEVIIVGDFEEAELERCVLRYLGTLGAGGAGAGGERVWDDEELYAKLFHLETRTRAVRARVEIPDDSVRSHVSMGFASVNRWGVMDHIRNLWEEFPGGERALDAKMRRHGDMFVARCIALLADIVNNRLYERVREKGGLVYSVDMAFDPLFYADAGFFTFSLAPFPDKIDVAVDLVKAIVADVQANGVTDTELEEARRPTLAEIRQNLEKNAYWLSLMQGLQSDDTQPKTLASVSDILASYKDLTVEDISGVARCVLKDFDKRLVVSTGLSGKYDAVSVSDDGPKP